MRAHIPIATLVLLLTPAVGPGLTAATANVEVITVCWDGSGDYLTIQEGIDAALDSDEVVVCDGIYTGDGNKNLDFGGKAITVRSATGPENCIIDCENDGRGFHFHNAETGEAVVDGFTIAEGNVEQGGAIRCEGSNPTISHCVLFGSTAVLGGGLFCQASDPTIVECTVLANRAWDQGGGIFCDNSAPTATACNITGNMADHGGAVYCQTSTPAFTSCAIIGNAALRGAGVFCREHSNLMLSDCTFSGNIASQDGGAILCEKSDPTITDCTIAWNTAHAYGGAIYSESSAPIVTNCAITENTALGVAALPGSGGAIYCADDSRPRIVRCTIDGNVAREAGGALLCRDSNLTITDCTINGNTAQGFAGGICCESSAATITNCTIAENAATGEAPKQGSGGGLYCIDNSRSIVINSSITANTASYLGGAFFCQGSTATIRGCDISGNSAEGEYCAGGGGIFCSDSQLTITGCTILENAAGYFGGGVKSMNYTNLIIAESTISRNVAGREGGGVYCHVSSPTMINCAIIGNAAWQHGGGVFCDFEGRATISNSTVAGNATVWKGGGICCFYGGATVTNTTIVGNTAYAYGGAFYCRLSDDDSTVANCVLSGNAALLGPEIAIACQTGLGTFTISYTDVRGGEAGVYVHGVCPFTWGPGNINADPLFVDPDGPDDDPNTWQDNDLHLSGGSPCIDAG
ncbi:MAG TPA: right-handed parallel beta-helix repeat-containing protein, partial [Phycisphaerae bacterium]|nr:right-handed parallel beta-helix repeat-containing protein [Phycisphaerae bacterium]